MTGKAALVCSATFNAGAATFRVSLAKAAGAAHFIFGVSLASGGNAELTHLCDRGLVLGNSAGGKDQLPVGLYGEVRDMGNGVNLLVLALLDPAPCALRVALVEPGSQRSWQLLVRNSD